MPEPLPRLEEPAHRLVKGDVNTIIGGLEEEAEEGKRQRLEEVITFTRANTERVQYPHHDAMVIILNIDDYDVHRVLINSGSSVDILFYDTF